MTLLSEKLSKTPAIPSTPPLMNGDRLTRAEFERRYLAMPEVKKAELIEGVVYMPSPVRHRVYSKPHMLLANWLGHYASKTPGITEFGDNGTIRLDNDNELQPDLYLMLPERAGGLARVDEDDYISGPPALICEIAASTVSIDLHAKKTAYRRNGVQEYLVWRTENNVIDWFSLQDGDFVLIPPDAEGTLRSQIFPGLWLNPSSILAGDLASSFLLLDRAASTPEHAEFVKQLSAI